VVWLVPLVFAVNLAGLALVGVYTWLNLRPDLPFVPETQRFVFLQLSFVLAVLSPALASLLYVLPVLRWTRPSARPTAAAVRVKTAQRAANAPLALATFSLLGWTLVTLFVGARSVLAGPPIAASLAVHLALRPLLAGLVVATGTYFVAEFICRTRVWPGVLADTRIAGNRHLWRLRIAHRLLVLWLAISALPLAAIALATYARVAGLDLAADPLLARVVTVVLFVALASAVGGGWLAWLVSRSVAQPLEALEAAMAHLREGRLGTRVVVTTTDEIGTVTEGFNLMATRLAQSHSELTLRNQELTRALDRVDFLEQVKKALDHFVPETVRHAIETDPEALSLTKKPMDVTVLFLDIEGYSRLSESLPRPTLNAMVERYFSLFLECIRAHGGDINETAGDGLMILFHADAPESHAAAALQAALAIQAQTDIANQEAGDHHPALRIKMGVSSGECDVGTTRFQGLAGERWTFTASGPVTNLAARLSAHARGGQILVSAETAGRLSGRFGLRDLGLADLRNLSHPAQVWEAPVPPPGRQLAAQ
jgi:class 3 adenylate cyclase/HAMP domain-containing protein